MYQEPIVNCTECVKNVVEDSFTDKVVKGVITIKAANLEELEIKLRSNGEKYTKFALNEEEWIFDRSKSGEPINGAEKDSDSLNGIRRMPISNRENVKITIVMDEFSVEIFEGGRVLSSTIYPPFDANRIELSVKADSCYYERADITIK